MIRPVYEDEEELKEERELTLSTGVILGIFLALVVLCGAFFGFGYKMGSRQPLPITTVDTPEGTRSPADFRGFKPAAGSPMTTSTASSSPPPTRLTSSEGARAASNAPSATAPVAAPPARTPAPEAATAEPSSATGNFVVQVAAVSHEEDAQLLVTALRSKGYPVSAHADATDKFFHIQVGPFTNMKDATAAKQRLMADGYQPIIK